jgi:phosphatidylinositol alpha-mannosyltransferase
MASSWRRRGSQLGYYVLELISSINPRAVAISKVTMRYLPLVKACIPCAVDPDVFKPGGERTRYPSILFVAGTLAGRKRGHLLLRAFQEVREELPHAELTVVCPDDISGTGITSVSDLSPTALAELYRSHWILCSTSSYEGFGVPYVEALASGLPVVTTTNDGAMEVLRSGELGVLTPAAHLGRSMVALLTDEARRHELIDSGINASAMYAVATVASQYERLYDKTAPPRAIAGFPIA